MSLDFELAAGESGYHTWLRRDGSLCSVIGGAINLTAHHLLGWEGHPRLPRPYRISDSFGPMTFELKKTEEGPVDVLSFSGEVSLAEVLDAFGEMAPGGEFRSEFRLWDVRGATFNLTTEDLKTIGEMSKTLDASGGKVAVLVDDQLSFGLARMYEVFRQTPEVELRVFREEAAAIQWLR